MKREMQWRGVVYTVDAKKPAKKASKKTSSKKKTVIKYRGSELEV
jgi:hypothetical protein